MHFVDMSSSSKGSYTSQLFYKSSPKQVVQFAEMNIQARNNKVLLAVA